MEQADIPGRSDVLSPPLDPAVGNPGSRADDGIMSRERLHALIHANEAIVQQLDLTVVLRRIVDMAVELVGAQYGALGVISDDGWLEEFIHVGIPDGEAEAIGTLPMGHGVLGALIKEPRPIRLARLAADPRSVGYPTAHPMMESFLGVPIRVRDEVYGNLYLTNCAAGEFTVDDEQLVVSLAETAGFAIDNARLFAETKRRQAWAAASAEITASLLSDEQAGAVALLASRVLELALADTVCVLLPTDDPRQFLVDTARGVDEELLEGALVPAADAIIESVAEGRQPRIVDEEGARESFLSRGGRFGPILAVPLQGSGDLLGVMVVSRLHGARRFTDADLELAGDFAAQASLSMELAGARADQQRVLLLEDRGRIARDLHDHVIQQLFAAGLELQNVAASLPPGGTVDRIDGTVGMLDTAITQIRTAVFALSNNRRDRKDTVRHRIVDVVNDLAVGLGKTPQLGFTGPVDLVIAGTLADDVIAVVRESLTNVVKHAAAENVSVRVAVLEGVVTVEVTDDGVGMSGSTRRSGVANLAERATVRGGEFDIQSGPGGTRLVWTANAE